MIRTLGRLAAALLIAVGVAGPAVAAQITSVEVTERAALARVRPDYPVPSDRGQAFYLQRSTNANTIVYAARFRADGTLDPQNPVRVYWRRYASDGGTKPLKWVEQRFAYGVNVRREAERDYTVWLKPLPEFPMRVRQTGPGEVEVFARIGGKLARPVYGYFEVDESGLIPQVTEFSVHGYVVETGRAISERFRVSGGEIRQ